MMKFWFVVTLNTKILVADRRKGQVEVDGIGASLQVNEMCNRLIWERCLAGWLYVILRRGPFWPNQDDGDMYRRKPFN